MGYRGLGRWETGKVILFYKKLWQMLSFNNGLKYKFTSNGVGMVND